ncbi:MAG: hypothetical protein AAGG00_03805 [Cyanobacteria bacterium P01_H01_bin.150]
MTTRNPRSQIIIQIPNHLQVPTHTSATEAILDFTTVSGLGSDYYENNNDNDEF